MQPSRIQKLIDFVPPNIPLYACIAGGTKDDGALNQLFIERSAHALTDPAFRWNFAVAFAEATQPLPVLADSGIDRAHLFLTTGWCDEHLRAALVVREPAMQLKRWLLHALLIMPAVTLDRIGELTSLPVEAVKLYAELWLDVRDRLDDICFIGGLVWPKTRLASWQTDYFATVQPEELLLRAAHNGDLNVVLELFGALHERDQVPAEELIRMLRLNILSEASIVAEVGGVHSADVPVLDRAMQLLTAPQERQASVANTERPKSAASWPVPGQTLLERAQAMLATNASQQFELTGGFRVLLDEKVPLPGTDQEASGPSEASGQSEGSDDGEASGQLTAKLRYPHRAVSPPSCLGRMRSWALRAENCPAAASANCL